MFLGMWNDWRGGERTDSWPHPGLGLRVFGNGSSEIFQQAPQVLEFARHGR